MEEMPKTSNALAAGKSRKRRQDYEDALRELADENSARVSV